MKIKRRKAGLTKGRGSEKLTQTRKKSSDNCKGEREGKGRSFAFEVLVINR